MPKMTTIQLTKPVLAKLKRAKEYERQTYNELLAHMTDVYLRVKKSGYDAILHEAQKHKMQEVWDNPEDEDWKHA